MFKCKMGMICEIFLIMQNDYFGTVKKYTFILKIQLKGKRGNDVKTTWGN